MTAPFFNENLDLLPPEVQARLMEPQAEPFPSPGMQEPVPETAPQLSPHDQPGGSYLDRLAMALSNANLPEATRPQGAFGQNLLANLARSFAQTRGADMGRRQQMSQTASEAARTLNAHRWKAYEEQSAKRQEHLFRLSESAQKAKENSPEAKKAAAKAVREGRLAADKEAGIPLFRQGGGGGNAPDQNVVELDDVALDNAAVYFGQTGVYPVASRGPAGDVVRARVQNRWGEISTGTGRPFAGSSQSIPSNIASFKADAGAQKTLQQNLDAVTAFEGTALANAKMAIELSKKIPDTGSPAMNAMVRSAKQKIFGDKDVAAFQSAMAVVQPEYARILANPTLSGELTDTARKEMKAVVDGSFTRAQLVSTFGVLSRDAENRRRKYQKQLDTIKGRIGSVRTLNPADSTQNNPDPLGVRGGP